jgi:hypothetical protein
MAVGRLVVKQILFIVPSLLSGALLGVISGSFMATPAAIAEEAMIMIPQQPVEPSLWWKKERLEEGWVDTIQVDTDAKQVIVIINPNRWLAADYLQRFSFLFKLGTEARSQNFNLILHNRRSEKIAEYSTQAERWRIDPKSLGAEPFRVVAPTIFQQQF